MYGYTPYGASTGGLSGTAFGYTGYRWDSETNPYHTQTRSYDPAMGRFILTDPIGYGGGRNLYAYTEGDPLNHADPQGTLDDDEDLGGDGNTGDIDASACPARTECMTVPGTPHTQQPPFHPGSVTSATVPTGGSNFGAHVGSPPQPPEKVTVTGHPPAPPLPSPPPVVMVAAPPAGPVGSPHTNVPAATTPNNCNANPGASGQVSFNYSELSGTSIITTGQAVGSFTTSNRLSGTFQSSFDGVFIGVRGVGVTYGPGSSNSLVTFTGANYNITAQLGPLIIGNSFDYRYACSCRSDKWVYNTWHRSWCKPV